MRNKQKQEALARMELLGLSEKARIKFEAGELTLYQSPMGLELGMDNQTLSLVQTFESKFNCLVYAVIRTTTVFGTQDAYLYVSNEEDGWEQDREDLKDYMPFAYIHNYLADFLSEIGNVTIEVFPDGRMTRLS